MPESKTKTVFNGQLVDGADVPVIEPNERWSEYKLEDGSTIRIKYALGSVVRIDNVFDHEGNPIYAVKGTTVVTLVSASDRLRKK